MKATIVQQVYPGRGFETMALEYGKRNTLYCKEHGLLFQFYIEERFDPKLGAWDKVFLIQEALQDYDFVMWLDADALLFDVSRSVLDVPLPEDSVGAVRYFLPVSHFNTGVLYFRNGDKTKAFLKKWVDGFPGKGSWKEQQVFNSMKELVTELPREWNRNYDNNPSANPVVMGFHGFGDADNRLSLMRKVLDGRHS